MGQLYIYHISIDGLRPDIVNTLKLKALHKIKKSGIYTDNARTDHNITITLPNHTGMFTSLPYKTFNAIVKQDIGHHVSFNEDQDKNQDIHKLNKKYIHSIFSELYNNNKTTAMYVNKTKFTFIYKSYPFINKFYCNTNSIIEEIVNDIINNKIYNYNFIHFGETDKMGHTYGWDSVEYKCALTNVDQDISKLLDTLDKKKINYYFIITTDHGGSTRKHSDIENPLNYNIPFYIYKNNGFNYKNNDLYDFNMLSRKRPSYNVNPDYNGMQPIRNSDTGNFILSLFKLPPIKNSLINVNQDLYIK